MNRTFRMAVFVATLSCGASVPAPAEPASAALPRLVASPEPGWAQFRGPRRDGTCDERGLLAEWPEGGPRKIWSADKIGRGYSSPIIAGGRIFITGDAGDNDRIFALDLDGRPLWQANSGAAWKEEFPGSRASVTFSDGRIYHENAHGRVACFDAANGKELWAVELLARFGGKNITWGLSECLLVDERAVYATAGGSEALLVALDKKSGAVIWKSTPLRDSEGERAIENASYASPILIQHGAQRLIVGCSLRHLFCADAADGAIRWTHRFPTTYSVISMMPALVGDSVFLTAPHGKGGRLLRLENGEERWSTRLDTLQGCVVQTGGKLIGCYYGGRRNWAAISAQTGELLYDTADFVKGAPLLADGRIYALCEDGWMLLLAAGEKQFDVKGRFRFAESQRDAWAHPVIHNGRLYLRYHDSMSCYDVRAVK
jgi:outer membrane protein assembly factor BamB